MNNTYKHWPCTKCKSCHQNLLLQIVQDSQGVFCSQNVFSNLFLCRMMKEPLPIPQTPYSYMPQSQAPVGVYQPAMPVPPQYPQVDWAQTVYCSCQISLNKIVNCSHKLKCHHDNSCLVWSYPGFPDVWFTSTSLSPDLSSPVPPVCGSCSSPSSHCRTGKFPLFVTRSCRRFCLWYPGSLDG